MRDNRAVMDTNIGEVMPLDCFSDMEWVFFDKAIDRLDTSFFLGRFYGAQHGPDRVAYCTMDEDGNVYALADDSDDDAPPALSWRLMPEPEEILVPAIWCHDMARAPHNKRILIKSDPSGTVYAAHWVQNVGTGDLAMIRAIAAARDEADRNLDRLHDDLARYLKVQRDCLERLGRAVQS